ncbi:MAG TPA: Rrf2 family transcriptional regulator [Candidatus Acidoferrales bacterium]|nr:Rrf2 family transcriptional regulator [Candidatus Acidoferrales bacterium]
MKVNSKGFYGLLAMADIAQNSKTGAPVQVKDIARRQRIPEEYLGQIMVLLKRAHLVRGTRGPGGGYHLTRAPDEITVSEVLKVLEGPLWGMDMEPQKNRRSTSVVVRRVLASWERAVEASEKVLREVTLADLCRPEEGVPMYYI